MQVIVVTGGLGSGKSTAAKYFRSRGAWTLDLDDIAAKLLSPGTALLDRVASEFGGDEVLLPDGRLDRPALARKAFATSEATMRLNSIVHPAVAREVGVAIDQMRLLGEPPVAVVFEVPLLAEAPVLAEVADSVLAIVAPERLRISRAVARGMDEDEATRRIRRQASDADRAVLANAVILNAGDADEFEEELAAFWEGSVAPRGVAR